MEAQRIDEKKTHNQLIPLDINLLNTLKSVCKIITNKAEGSGFLIKLNKNMKDLYCLMTNEHIISKEMINLKQKIIIYYDMENKNREIILDKRKRFINEFTNIGIDITIIEIIKEDKIKEKYFLLPYLGDDIINKNIYIIQYPDSKLSYSKGKIIKIHKNEIIHDVSTELGSSGSPIFIENTKCVLEYINKEILKKKKIMVIY